MERGKPLGALTQLPGKAGCFTHDGSSEDGANTCGKARGMPNRERDRQPRRRQRLRRELLEQRRLARFRLRGLQAQQVRRRAQAAPGKAGCLTADGSSNAGAGTCTEARGIFDRLGDGHDLVFTPNGRWAYMAADGDPSGILIFKRNPSTGALAELSGTAGCITTTGADQNGAAHCQVDSHLLDASGLTFSSDTHFLYVTGTGGSRQIEVFSQLQHRRAHADRVHLRRRPPRPVAAPVASSGTRSTSRLAPTASMRTRASTP